MRPAPLQCPECGRTGPAVARCPCGGGVFVPPAAAADPLAGRIIGPYAVGPPIAAGGTARVYAAHDGRRAAVLKALPAHATARDRARFAREARALSTLDGPHTARLLDYGEARDRAEHTRPWIAQARVPGPTLRQALDAGPLTADRIAAIADAVLCGLAAAHRAGVVHRDLKPANIVLPPDGGVVIVDFGLARLETPALTALTTTGAVIGTPHYMAPEQIDHRAPIGPAADQYAAAIILYELCAGRRPFDDLDPLRVMRRHLDDAPPPLPRRAPLRRRWHGPLRRALAKAPAARYPTIDALRDALSPPRWARWLTRPTARRSRPPGP